MPNINSFDWFSLDRNVLFNLLYPISDKIVGQKLTTDQLHSKISTQLRKHLPIKIKKTKHPKVEKGWVYVGGAYYPDKDEDDEKCIEIEFAFNTNEKSLEITSRRFARMCWSFADTVLHEIIHMRQHRRRDWRIIPNYPSTARRIKQRIEQEYLGCRDEIDAYSFNIACELYDKFHGRKGQIIKYMNENQKGLKRRHNGYRMYLNAFGHDHSHPIIKHLKKKVVSYLPQAAIGKPYKNGEWINY